MPDILPASSKIGALLRKLQESRSESPTETTPTDQPSAPIRETVQAPLEEPIAPESPGTARTVSLRPEGVTQPTATGAPEVVAPTTSKVGPIGGPGYEGPQAGPRPGEVDTSQLTPQQQSEYSVGLDIGRELPRVPEPAPPQAPPQAPISYEAWQAQSPDNRGFSKYLGMTGQQNVLDAIGGTPGTSINQESGVVSGLPGGLDANVVPQPAGGIAIQQIPRPQGQPNTATLQDYLAQGKTPAQWYAETGRQSEYDVLTQGATQPIPTDVQSAFQQGITPTVSGGQYTIPQAPATPEAGAPGAFSANPLVAPGSPTTIASVPEIRPQITPTAATSEFIGPLGPQQMGISLEELQNLGGINEQQSRIAALDALEQALQKPPEQRSEEEQEIVELNIARNIGTRIAQDRALQRGVPTPTPRPLIPIPTLTPTPARR